MTWHSRILQAFGQILQTKAKRFLIDLQTAREGLEKLNFDSFSIQDDVSSIVYLQEMAANEHVWMADFKEFDASDKLLKKQRFVYPNEWIGLDCLNNELVFFLI